MSKLVETKHWSVHRKKGGGALRELRSQRGATQDELSEASGVPKTLISRLELGGTEKPSLEMAVKLWGALGLSPTRAAQDYGVFLQPKGLEHDPREDEVRAMMRHLPETLQEEMFEYLYQQAKLFVEMHASTAAQTV